MWVIAKNDKFEKNTNNYKSETKFYFNPKKRENMEDQIKKLRVGLFLLAGYSLILTIVIILFAQKYKSNQFGTNDIIRTKGIVIEDTMGKARILIGTPIPFVDDRIRTDTNKVKELWSGSFPEYWFDLYKNEYNHQANGILILDENGHDRLVIGDPVPDLYFGKRIGPSTGIIINDDKGQERTGYGLLKVDGIYHVNLGLDAADGTEGLMLMLNDDGTTGIAIQGSNQAIFLGKVDTLNWFMDEYPFNGLFVKDSTGIKYNFNSWNKTKTTTNNVYTK